MSSSYLPLLAFLLTFLFIILLVHLLAKLIQKAIEGMAMGPMNKLAGALFGLLKYILIISVFIYISDPHIPPAQKKDSVLYLPTGKIAPLILPQLKELPLEKLDDAFRQ